MKMKLSLNKEKINQKNNLRLKELGVSKNNVNNSHREAWQHIEMKHPPPPLPPVPEFMAGVQKFWENN